MQPKHISIMPQSRGIPNHQHPWELLVCFTQSSKWFPKMFPRWSCFLNEKKTRLWLFRSVAWVSSSAAILYKRVYIAVSSWCYLTNFHPAGVVLIILSQTRNKRTLYFWGWTSFCVVFGCCKIERLITAFNVCCQNRVLINPVYESWNSIKCTIFPMLMDPVLISMCCLYSLEAKRCARAIQKILFHLFHSLLSWFP